MNEKLAKSSVAIVQSFLVILLTYLLSAVRETEIVSTTAIVLYILHYFVFYISDYGRNFFKRRYLIELVQTLKYILFFALAISISNFFLEDRFSISRRGMIYFLLLHVFLVYMLNLFIKWYWKRAYPNFKGSKKVFLLTATSHVEKVLDRLIESDDVVGELVAVSVLDKSDFQHDDLKVVAEGEIVNFATREVVDEVFINLPSEKYNIGELVSQFETMGIDVTVNLNAFDWARNKQICEMAGLNVVTFSTTFYKTSHVIAKRVIDIIGSLVGLILCGLVSIVLVPLIRKDGGSAIFAQTRIGKNGRHFTFYKFRSMCVDAEDKKRELMEQNTMQGGMFKVDDDPRITKIGHFIRKTSLDELPQFYNVLKGDMSLVGTRPPTVDEYEHYTPEQKRRLSFKPGITGLWQVSGRSEIKNFDEVVKLDVVYIDGWTIWKDIEILLKTVKVVLMKDGAK
ncbi:TPA: sugar transferase [Streptococcus pneumoniae]|nr:sugar transferase [Streptococcus pneumoniae]HEV1680590.1 sugar transferase [Streptococcus pneumoniae]